MAFNPFNWFRKHQKKLIAVVIVFVMFIFVLSFGRGDLFDRSWGEPRDRSDVVATIHGKEYRELAIERLGKQRKMASDFLLEHAARHHDKVLADLLQKELKADPKADLIIDPYQRLRRVCTATQRRTQILPFLGMQRSREVIGSMLINSLNQIQGDLQTLEELASDEKFAKDSDNLARLGKVSTILGFQLWQFERILASVDPSRAAPDDLYFGGNSKRLEDTLDFLMWKHQADKLGISLVDADIAREINREAAGHEVFAEPDKVNLEKDKKVIEFVNRHGSPNMRVEQFVESLRDAFRTVMAQGVLLGSEPGVRAYRSLLGAGGSPAAGSPDEFLAFYREMRTVLKAQFLAVPAEKFLDKVKQTPDEAELRARYEKFKNQEPNPLFRDPGFKEPRRVLVQYLVGDAGHKVYRDKARQHAAFHISTAKTYRDRARPVASLVGLASRGPLEAVASASAMAVQNPLALEYDRYVADNSPPWLPPGPNADVERLDLLKRERRVRMSSVHDPATLASAVGGAARGPLNGLGSLSLMSLYVETRDSVRQTGGVMLATGDPHNLFGVMALALATQPRTLPYERMEPQLLAQLEERLARDILREELETISKELSKHKKEPEKAQEYLTKALKDHPGLKLVSMPEPRSQLTLALELERKVDLKLDTLLTTFQKRMLAQRERDFVANLFQGQGVYEPQRLRAAGRFGLEDDDQSSDFDRTEILWWRKEDLPARVRPYEAVRDDVVRAWKMDYARQLARDEAVKLEREIRAAKYSPADAERFLREKQKDLGPLFELDNVSQLVVPSREVHMIVEREDYRPYQIPADRQPQMPYVSPSNLVKHLLTLDRPGDATVISDMPQSTYYVAVLVARDEPSVRQFREVYSRTPLKDPLYGLFTQQKTDEYRRTVTEGLRRLAGKVGKDGRFEVPESIRKRDSRTEVETE